MFGWLFGVDSANAAAAAKAEQKLATLNRDRYERGLWTYDQYQQAEANRYGARVDVDKELADAFQEGAKEGAANIQKAIHDGAAGVINWGFGAIPWQVILLGAVVLFFWMGGASVLKGRLK